MALPPDGKVVACDITDEHLKTVSSTEFFKEVYRNIALVSTPPFNPTLPPLVADMYSAILDRSNLLLI